jgi:hypothetical protein
MSKRPVVVVLAVWLALGPGLVGALTLTYPQ